MKNYFFFEKHEQNWNINFRQLDNQILSFQLYMSFFHPRYNYRALTNDFLDDKEIQYQNMNTHDYFYINRDDYTINGIPIPIGSILLSNARNEGNVDIKSLWEYYFLQPAVAPAYYSIFTSPRGITNTYQDKADELNYNFSFTLVNRRWYAEKWAVDNISRTFDFEIVKEVKETSTNIFQPNGYFQKELLLPNSSILYFSDSQCDELITDYNIQVINSDDIHTIDFIIKDENFNNLINGHNIKFLLF